MFCNGLRNSARFLFWNTAKRACVLSMSMDGNRTESARLVIGNLVEKWFGEQQTVTRRWNASGRKWWRENKGRARDKAGKKDSVWLIQATVAPRSATGPGHSWFLANESVAAGPTIPIPSTLPAN